MTSPVLSVITLGDSPGVTLRPARVPFPDRGGPESAASIECPLRHRLIVRPVARFTASSIRVVWLPHRGHAVVDMPSRLSPCRAARQEREQQPKNSTAATCHRHHDGDQQVADDELQGDLHPATDFGISTPRSSARLPRSSRGALGPPMIAETRWPTHADTRSPMISLCFGTPSSDVIP